MKSKWILGFTCLALAITPPSQAATEKPLFESSDEMHIAIQAPLWSLIKDRSNRTSIPGTLTDPNGQSLPISLALRGITRRTSEICDFPPLRVNFTAPPPPNSPFAGQKKLKLVTHCKNSASFQQYVLLEYAAYRMYNLLTPRSFRVRLASIDYRDATGHPIASNLGYFIEDLSDVAHRNGLKVTHAPARIPTTYLSSPDAARYALFEDMIGNHDWSMRAGPAGSDCCHNAELIGVAGPGTTIPIAYDFDFSGFVNTPYATPPAELDISDVRQRFYRGYCMHNKDVVAAAAQMRSAEPQILGVLSQVPGLDAHSQQRGASYLQGFFVEIGNDSTFNSRILNHCVRG
jgi:hypothetical protein